MTSAAKHTAGPWKAMAAGIDAITVSTTLRNGRRVPFRVACCKDGDIEQVQANARLIAEAGTVAHETGLTPRQLAEQRDDLLEALRNITECAEAGADGANMDLWIAQARAALAKAEGEAQ